MSYRIDIDGKNRYDASGGLATSVSEEQRRFFIEQINQAVRERAEARWAEDDRSWYREGDRRREGRQSSRRSLRRTMSASTTSWPPTASSETANSAAIDPNDVVIVPLASPELVAQGPVDGKGVPKGEAAFIDDLYGRGNKLAYADDPSKIDYDRRRQGHAARRRRLSRQPAEGGAPGRRPQADRTATGWMQARPATPSRQQSRSAA